MRPCRSRRSMGLRRSVAFGSSRTHARGSATRLDIKAERLPVVSPTLPLLPIILTPISSSPWAGRAGDLMQLRVRRYSQTECLRRPPSTASPPTMPKGEWTAGMGEGNQTEYPLAASDPDALLEWMRPQVDEMANISPQIVNVLSSIISDVDKDSLSGEFGEVVAASFQRAFVHGPWG